MKRDIFIDNNIAKDFANPMQQEYLDLVLWLNNFDEDDVENKDSYAHLVLSQKLIVEYVSSANGSLSSTCMPAIISKLTKEGRIVKFSKSDIENFKQKYYSKRILRQLSCNYKDREHIPIILLSDRKIALSLDKNFINDLVNFPGFTAIVAENPADIDYKEM